MIISSRKAGIFPCIEALLEEERAIDSASDWTLRELRQRINRTFAINIGERGSSGYEPQRTWVNVHLSDIQYHGDGFAGNR